jgi:protocatechuate 3,4-dioxygenase beta subunit
MKNKKQDGRRQFLRNTSLAALSFGILPATAKNNTEPQLNSSILCDEITEDYYGQGPFYTANAPNIQNNQLADINEVGTKIIISGRVFNLDCAEAIPNTIFDIWQANDAGSYDNSGFNLRGKAVSNSQGFYIFESIKPGLYLNGSTYRPSHIHFKITTPFHSAFTTQLYFSGDPYIANDAAASITSGTYDATNRIIPLTTNANGDLEGTWDVVISGSGISVGDNNIHLDKGIIYSASPNPFNNRVEIKYGVFQKGLVSVFVYDIHGRVVSQLEKKQLSSEKYEVMWEPEEQLPNGHYFIALKINDLQVHYLKVIRKS